MTLISSSFGNISNNIAIYNYLYYKIVYYDTN